MDFHNYVNKGITFVRSNGIMMYARGKHTQLNIGWTVRPKYGLGCTTNVRMVIQSAKDLEWTIAHSLQSNRVARSFEFTRHSSIVGIPVENNRGPRNERRWQEVLWYQELLRGGEILTTFLTKRDGNTSEVRKVNCWVAVMSMFTQNANKLCWTEGNKVVDENRNHRGARMVLPIMNSIEFLEELIRLMMITTQLSRDFMQM